MGPDLLDYAVARLSDAARMMPVYCKICRSETQPYDILDFNKSCSGKIYPTGLSQVPVIYRICPSCRFIFTDFFDNFSFEQWKTHVYNDEYVIVDPDYAQARSGGNAETVSALLSGIRTNVIGLDYGGGNGATAAQLRQKGWTYDTYDPFDHVDMAEERIGRYNFCSAIEVFEHTPDPIGTLRTIVEKTSPDRLLIFVSTSTHDRAVSPQTRLSWWYAAPRNGHISLHSHESLRLLGQKFRLDYTSISGATHLFSRGVDPRDARWLLLRGKTLQRLRKTLRRR